MNQPLPLLSEDEVRHCIPADEEAGFGALATPRGRLPLRALEVHTRIDGLLAQVNLSQTFVNAFDEPLEATYIFPLPDRSAVTRFRMEVGQRVVEGVLKERTAARREYDVAMQAGHRAAIAEEERPGVFTLRVGNLMPGESAAIHLTLSGPVLFDSGEVTYRFPLVVAPRYIPGVPLPGPSVGAGTVVDTDTVPDASRITPPVLLPGYPSPVRLALSVEVHPGALPVSDLRCSLHAAVAERWEGGGFRIALQPGERLNRDFILRYRHGEEAIRSALSLHPDPGNRQEGTFALFLLPPLQPALPMRPRDVVFVLDRSGSMAGWKMVAARRALARMVDSLAERDRFTVYAFDDRLETPPTFGGLGLVSASDRNRFRAVEFLARIESRGGTEMAQPLDLAVQHLTGERDRVLVLVTDGQVGNEDQILHALGKRLADLRIFTLGIDQAVNEAFLRRLAALGGGCCDVVESEDRLDEVMEKVQRRIGTPLLTGLRLEVRGLRLDPASLTPARLPDLFAGTALTVLGRYRGAPEGAITLQARDEAGRPWSQAVTGRVCENPAVAQVWARGQVRALEDRFVIGEGDLAALEKKIIELSLRFGVLCRFTAFVAVDRSEVVNEGGQRHQVTQPVEAPAGWEMLERAAVAKAAAPALFAAMPSAPDEECEALDYDLMLGVKPTESGEVPLRAGGVAGSPMPPRAACYDSAAELPKDESDRQLREMSENLQKALDMNSQQSAQPIQNKGNLMGKRAARKTMLAKQVLQELNAGGRVSKKTQLALDDDLQIGAYRRRAQELLESVKKATGVPAADQLRILGILTVKLAALIEDLKSIGVSADALGLLEKLHADLQQLVNTDQPAEAEVVRLWAECKMTLQAFVSGGAAGAAMSVAEKRV
jgi:Ca-activated chloride channel family protein